MRRPRAKYGEGTWIAVPLEKQKWAVGLIVAADVSGRVLVGYFFGPARSEIPSRPELDRLTPADAIYVCQFGDYGLHKGLWKVILSHGEFDPERWPVPDFVRKDLISGSSTKIRYERRPLREVEELPCPLNDCNTLAEDVLHGSEVVENELGYRLLK